MKKSRRKFSKGFKQKAVELSNVRGSVPEIARELDIREQSPILFRIADLEIHG